MAVRKLLAGAVLLGWKLALPVGLWLAELHFLGVMPSELPFDVWLLGL